MVNSRLWGTACETTVLKLETKTLKNSRLRDAKSSVNGTPIKNARDFKIGPKFSGIHIFRETIIDDYLCALASDA